MFDDDAVDSLAGDGGSDWFMFNSDGGPFVDHVADMTVFEDMFNLDL